MSSPAVLNLVSDSQRYREGQRICRLIALFNPELGMRFGHVSRVYSTRPAGQEESGLYEVIWADGETESGLEHEALYLVPDENEPVEHGEAKLCAGAMAGAGMSYIGLGAIPSEMSIRAYELAGEISKQVRGKVALASGMVRFDLSRDPVPRLGWTMPRIKLDRSLITPRSREESLELIASYRKGMADAEKCYFISQLCQAERESTGRRYLPNQVIARIYRKAKLSMEKTGQFIMSNGKPLKKVPELTFGPHPSIRLGDLKVDNRAQA